jgi:MFS family permease
MNPEIHKSFKHNFIVNILDGAFFGFALGCSSFVTVLPLFVSTLTNSATIIGLVPAFHNVGWQLPQLLTANSVARQKKFKPMVLRITIHERFPFLGLAIVALLIPTIGAKAALALTFVLLAWQGLGGGFTANPWQSMIAKIMPPDRRSTFYGLQSSAANLLASLSAVAAGFILERFESYFDFAICFFLTAAIMAISMAFLAMTKEPEGSLAAIPSTQTPLWSRMGEILKRDKNFGWFLTARILSQFAIMGFAFYTVYAVRVHHVSESEVGIMTGILLGAQILANPIMGWIGDKWSNLIVLKIGITAAILSAFLAWWAPSPNFFYLVFGLTGIAYVSIWTIGLAIILEFGCESERPVYIGMANTLAAPANILAPFLGGWLADLSGYPSAFLASAFGGLAALLVYVLFVKDPRTQIAS